MIKVSCNLIEGELILIFEIFCKHRENSKHFCFVRNWLIFLTLKYILSGHITQTKKRKLWLVWPYRTKTGSLRCYLPFITNFRQKSTIIINCFHWYILFKTSTILTVTESWDLTKQEHFGRAYTDFAESYNTIHTSILHQLQPNLMTQYYKKDTKPHCWVTFYYFWPFLPKRNWLCHAPTRAPINTKLRFRKN